MNERNSSFELTKVIGIFLIVLSHVAYHSEINVFGSGVDEIIAAFFTYMGQVGNGIFIFSICWFAKEKFNLNRVVNLILVTLFYSYAFLIVFLIKSPGTLSGGGIIKSLLPIAFANNWFITAYFLFSLFLPYLFVMINSISRKQHLYLIVGFLFFYCFTPSILGSRYFITSMMSFLLIFFLVSYIRKYDIRWKLDKKTLYILLGIMFLSLFLVIAAINFAGTKISLFYGKTLFWLFPTSIFILPISIVIFMILCRCKYWTNKTINFISSCSIGVYLCHENKLLISNGFYAWLHAAWHIPVALEFFINALMVLSIALIIEVLRKKLLGNYFYVACDFVSNYIVRLQEIILRLIDRKL